MTAALSCADQHQQQQERLLKGAHNLRENQTPTPASRALYAACSREGGPGLHQVSELLATPGANPNWYNDQKGGETALHAASRHQGAEAARVVAALIAAGAEPGVVSLPEFNTPLHLAAASGNLETVKLLIEWHLKANDGTHAPTAQRPPALALVLRQGNAYGNSPLHEASINGHDAVAAYLLEADDRVTAQGPRPGPGPGPHQQQQQQALAPLVDISNKRGSTPLLFALYGTHPPTALVERLLARGADLGHTDHDGVGALHVCASQGHAHLLPLVLAGLRARGRDVAALATARDANGHDPAFYARMSMKGGTGAGAGTGAGGGEAVLRMLLEAAAAATDGGGKQKK